MDLRRQAWIRRVIRRVRPGQQPCPRACEAAGRVQDVKPACRIAKTQPSGGDPTATHHRRVTEVAVLTKAGVSAAEVVEGDSEADRPPSRYAVLVAAPSEARGLAEGADRSVERAISVNKEPADLNVATDNDRGGHLRRRCPSEATDGQRDRCRKACASCSKETSTLSHRHPRTPAGHSPDSRPRPRPGRRTGASSAHPEGAAGRTRRRSAHQPVSPGWACAKVRGDVLRSSRRHRRSRSCPTPKHLAPRRG